MDQLHTSTFLKYFTPPVRFHIAVEQDPRKSFAEQMNGESISVSVEVNPELLEMIEEEGFVRRGSRRHVYAMPYDGSIQSRENVHDFISRYSEKFQPFTLYSSVNQVAYTSAVPNSSFDSLTPQSAFDSFITHRNANRRPNFSPAQREVLKSVTSHSDFGTIRKANPTPFTVRLQQADHLLWLRIEPSTGMLGHDFDAKVDLNEMWKFIDSSTVSGVYRHLQLKKPSFTFLEFDKFSKIFHRAPIARQHLTEESAEFYKKLEELEDYILVSNAPGKPALGSVRAGAKAAGLLPRAFQKNTEEITLRRALSLSKKLEGSKILFHPSLLDVSNMIAAKPFKDDRLRPYQQEAVGLHLSTKVGYLNACAPGLGKTVMQLTGMRERSKSVENYRGLVITETNVLEQWQAEAKKWFPEARVVETLNNKNLADVTAALVSEGPVVVFMPYSQLAHVTKEAERIEAVQTQIDDLRSDAEIFEFLASVKTEANLGSLILNTYWNDIAADEAMVLRNNTSKQARAAWRLRQNSEVAVALTGTPINKAVSDIANLLSWVRNDRTLFQSVNFDESYDLTKKASAAALFSTFGPLVFRRDTTEISEELPSVGEPKVSLFTANTSERALIDAAEHELRRCHEELLAALEAVETNADNEEAITAMKEELKAARQAWLGGQMLARMATSDPQSLNKSNSVGAALLIGQGLVEAALTEVPTKRAALVTKIAERVANRQQSLVFVEFEETAQVLKRTLQDNGINAETFTGKNRNTRDAHRVSFQDGTLDVLILTQAGERGITLHKATAVYCYDLPWSLEKMVQRIGRAVRIGSENEKVDIEFFVMADTVEERIAVKLVSNAVKSASLLDATRGAKLKNTEMMGTLGGLVGTIASRSNDKSLKEFGKAYLKA